MKERLIGAAVLMAAAVILIPEMLSGPDRGESEAIAQEMSAQRTVPSGEAPMKTYTIDLNREPGAPLATQLEHAPAAQDTRPRAREGATAGAASAGLGASSATRSESLPQTRESATGSAAAGPGAASQGLATEEAGRTAASTARGDVAEDPTSPALATRASTPTSGSIAGRQAASAKPSTGSEGSAPTSRTPAASAGQGWAVQVGSYSKRATAERLTQQLRQQGRQAFVMPVQTGGKTLYRVRIGPMSDRASAEAALRSVKSSMPGAALVTHP